MFIVIAAIISLFASFISGLFGGGAGLLTVPGFYWLLVEYFPDAANLMQTTIGTGCWLSIPLGAVATWRQIVYKSVDTVMLKRSIVSMLSGATCGAFLLNYTHSHVIKYAFSVSIFLVAFWMMRYNAEKAHCWRLSRLSHNIVGFFVAFISAILGVSVLFVPFFVKLGLDIRKAIGTSTVIVFIYGFLNAIWLILLGMNQADLPPNNIGYLNLPIFLAGIIPSIVGGLLAVKLVHTVPRHYIKGAFVTLMFVVSIIMAFPH